MTTDQSLRAAPADHDPVPTEPAPRVRRSFRDLLRRYRVRLAALAATAGLGGVAEAVILVLIARIAFAAADDVDEVQMVGSWSVGIGGAFAIGAAAVVLTITLQILAAWQSAHLTAFVIERVREDLTEAFLGASWESQHDERSGQLQELLTTFIRGGAQLISATARGTIAACNLVALTIVVVFIDPAVAAVLLLVVLALGSLMRPLRKRVRREAGVTAEAGMRLATSLNEVSELGMEMHVFNVQPQARGRLSTLIRENKVTNRRLDFLNQLTPTTYAGTAYLAMLGALGIVVAAGVADIAAVGTVTLIMFRVLRYGQTLQLQLTHINANLPFLEQLDDELDRYRRAKAHDGTEPVSHVGTMELDDVSFEYHPGVPVLHGMSATISPSEVIGIVGPSGSGKSTLVQLLLR